MILITAILIFKVNELARLASFIHCNAGWHWLIDTTRFLIKIIDLDDHMSNKHLFIDLEYTDYKEKKDLKTPDAYVFTDMIFKRKVDDDFQIQLKKNSLLTVGF